MAIRIEGVDSAVRYEDIVRVCIGKWLSISATVSISKRRGNVLELPLAAQLSFLLIVSKVYYGTDTYIYLS